MTDAMIPFESLEDPYWGDHPEIYEFEVMLRSFIYGELRGIRYHQDLADFLERNPTIAFTLGFKPDFGPENEYPALNVFQTPKTPHQTTITRCANKRFLAQAERFITDVADRVEAYCRRHTHLVEMHELWSETDDTNPGESEEKLDPDGLTKEQIRRLVNELMRHVCPNISFQRGVSKQIRKNLFLEVIAHCGLTNSSVYGGGDVFDIYLCPEEEELPHGRTFFDHMEGIALEEMLEMFDAAVESMVGGAKDIGLYDRPVDLAIDVTTVKYTGIGKSFSFQTLADPDSDEWSKRERSEAKAAIEEWELEPIVGEDPADIKHANFDNLEKRAAARRVKDCVRWVNGTKDQDEEIAYGFQFAAAAFAEHTCPMIYGVKPINNRTGDELAGHVRQFVERAQDLVVVDTVYMDAAYGRCSEVHNLFHYGHGFRTGDRFDVEYVTKVPERSRGRREVLEERYKIEHRFEDGKTALSIKRNYGFGDQHSGTGNAHTTLVAVKKWSVDTVADKVTDRVVFATNHQGEDPVELMRFINGYRDRWVIENGFKEVKKFLAETRSSSEKPRLFYFLFAVLLFNVWMLIDRVAKKRLGMEFAGEPIIKFEVFVAAVANFMRPVD
ncbi:transposase [Natrarchaeobius halalkaliphilus]|uniref:Transposase n=1 Tax=Natrarchaeobius halalkaliphilus TaxID=1679091 RepID=A0A3N6LKG7_9EURY|nr:transposase [Natrarchaeobius halalkaliphilus]